MNTILIADPEPGCRQQIRQHIGSRPGFRVVGECGNPYETIRYVNALEPDVLFLDAQLGGSRAFDWIQQVAHLPKIIYTARSESHALRAFDHQALDYLLKPYGAARLDAALQKVARPPAADDVPDYTFMPQPCRRNLFVEDGGRLRRIAVNDIRYLKAAGDYTVVYTEQGEFLSSSGIGCIGRKLDPTLFVRVHRSFMVNLERIDTCYRDIGKLYLVMENGQEISVGKHYLNNIKSLIL
ncbi:LytR/AlgR family response regulator transcription factor [Parapedobacter koreensis]|uniref:Two component transcriptional regulator, LytTR family n=1 Tax=Parapedobacter koreensis TaxID=332977 RepID=A0A1H7QY74_9SPHI|nr:LytTR family DNA-binding domain-containing protein [Parapedobacter koreensis]SEL52862.1 two component transcriptional regulator, LytTR family [Parapedobacter koreensis]